MSPDWREPFERALDEDPSDQRVRRDLADHLEERGDPDAEPVRWLAGRGHHPVHEGVVFPWEGARYDPGRPWNWWRSGVTTTTEWAPGAIPPEVFDLLGGEEPSHPEYRDENRVYPTRRHAEADLCRAYHLARAQGWDPAEG